MINNNNKRKLESFVVAKVGQTSIPTSGTYYNSATGAVSLADGQLGIISDSIYGSVAPNVFVNATPTVTTAPVIKILSGTAQSANPAEPATYPLWNRPFRATSSIDARGTVVVTKQAYRAPEHSVWVIGNTVGETNAVNISDETLYQISVGFRSRRTVEAFSNEQAAYLRPSYTSKNYTALGLSDALATDDILTHLSWDINRNSQQFALNSRFPSRSPILALLIDTTGTTGTAIGGVDPIVAGDVINVVTTAAGTKTLTLTEALATSIKDAAIAATGDVIADVTWSIMVTNLASAGSATGGTADVLMLVALDHVTAYTDFVEPIKVTLEVALPTGFDYNTVRYLHANTADEGQGLFRQMDLYWKKTQGQREYNLRHTEDPIVNFATPFVSGEKYVTYSFNHSNWNQVDTSNVIASPFLDIVAIPAFSTGTTPNPLIATFDGIINSWLASTAHNDAIVTV